MTELEFHRTPRLNRGKSLSIANRSQSQRTSQPDKAMSHWRPPQANLDQDEIRSFSSDGSHGSAALLPRIPPTFVCEIPLSVEPHSDTDSASSPGSQPPSVARMPPSHQEEENTATPVDFDYGSENTSKKDSSPEDTTHKEEVEDSKPAAKPHRSPCSSVEEDSKPAARETPEDSGNTSRHFPVSPRLPVARNLFAGSPAASTRSLSSSPAENTRSAKKPRVIFSLQARKPVKKRLPRRCRVCGHEMTVEPYKVLHPVTQGGTGKYPKKECLVPAADRCGHPYPLEPKEKHPRRPRDRRSKK